MMTTEGLRLAFQKKNIHEYFFSHRHMEHYGDNFSNWKVGPKFVDEILCWELKRLNPVIGIYGQISQDSYYFCQKTLARIYP